MSKINPDKVNEINKKILANIENVKNYITLTGHTSPVICLILLNDGTFASGSFDATIKILDTITGQEIKTLTGHTSPVICLILLNDGTLASGSFDKTIKIWDTITGQEIKT